MSEFFLAVVNMSISASWIVLAVLILRLLLKKAPKWITVLLWGIVAVRLICPFSVESVMSLIPSAETINPEILVEQAPVINPNIPVINGTNNGTNNGTDTPVAGEPVTPVPDMTPVDPVQTAIPVLSAVWLVGIAGMLAYTGISYFRVKGKIGTAIRLRDNIFQSESVVSPFVLGVIKPKIYLPFCIDGQDMDYVIAHENAHIRRKDHWWKPIGFLILTIHWFNPLLWLGYVLLCRDIELACDEKVVKELDFQQKADYSQALLNCSVNRRILAACPLAFGEIGVKDRVKSVLNYKKPAFWIIVVAIVASIVTAVCFLTDPVDKTPDDTTQQTDLSDATENTEPSDVTDSLTEKFLKGEISATDKDGRKVSIQDYLRGDYNKYALYDMSGDAVPELILKTGEGLTIFSVKEQGLTVWYQGTIYEKPLNNRAIFYERPGGAPEHTSYQYIVLDHNGEELQRTSFVESSGDNAECFINGERVSKTAYEDLYKSFHLSDDAIVWKDIAPIDGTNSNKDQQSQNSTTEDLGAAESALLSVLQNKNTFITSKGATVSLKDYKPVYKHPETADYYEETDVFVPQDYTFVDLDGDGKRELIVAEEPYAESYLILRQENQSIYGYSLEARWFQSLKQDGSFQSSGGALIHNYNTISFSQNTYQMSTIAKFYFEADNKKPVSDKYGYAPDYEKSVFEINGKQVSFEEIKQFAEAWDNRPDAVWIQFTDTAGGDTTDGQSIKVAEPFASVLNNKKSFYFENEGKSVILSDYYKAIGKLASVDIDSDGNKEIAVMFGAGDGTLILWQDGTSVYGYEFGFREMYRLNQDSTYLWNTNSGNTYGCSSIAIEDNRIITTEVWRVEHDGAGGFTYYIGKELASKELFDTINQLRNSESVDWIVFSSNTTIVGTTEEEKEEEKESENPYPIREITDSRVTAGENHQTYRDSFISLNFPSGWKCQEQWGEDGLFVYFQDPVLGENCQLSIYFASATIYTYDYTSEEYMASFTGHYGYEDVVIDSLTKETIQGFPCTKIVYSYTEDNTRFVGVRYDDLIEGPRLYHITITYPAEESKTYEKEFAAIIESVRFAA